jgi:hypothetical protein
MPTIQALREAYLFNNSPFMLPVDEPTYKAVLEQAREQPLSLAIARELVVLANLHLAHLNNRLELFGQLNSTTKDLLKYKWGLLAPLEIIIASFSGTQGNPEEADIALYGVEDVDNGAYLSFLQSKISQCRTFMKKADTKEKWEEMCMLAIDYDTSDYYRVGVIASQMAFTFWDAIARRTAKGQRRIG